MKKSLLATVAVAALIAGPAMAQRQEAPAGKTEAPARAPASMQQAPAEKAAPGKALESQAPAKAETSGQAAPSGQVGDTKAAPAVRSGASTDTKSGASTDTKPGSSGTTATDTKSGSSGTMATDSKPGAAGAAGSNTAVKSQASDSGSVALSTEQKTKIRSSVLTANAPRVTNVNFSINVGTVVPRSVRLVAVPAPLIEIHPAWRGFMYFVYGDEIIIVEPGTLRIVAVIAV